MEPPGPGLEHDDQQHCQTPTHMLFRHTKVNRTIRERNGRVNRPRGRNWLGRGVRLGSPPLVPCPVRTGAFDQGSSWSDPTTERTRYLSGRGTSACGAVETGAGTAAGTPSAPTTRPRCTRIGSEPVWPAASPVAPGGGAGP